MNKVEFLPQVGGEPQVRGESQVGVSRKWGAGTRKWEPGTRRLGAAPACYTRSATTTEGP